MFGLFCILSTAVARRVNKITMFGLFCILSTAVARRVNQITIDTITSSY
jgi:hypothetical protein